MLSTTLISLLPLAILLPGVLAAPSSVKAARDYEVGVVTPGPGLPSLESLGLTNEDLYNPEFQAQFLNTIDTNTTLESRQATAFCSGGPINDLQNVLACVGFLNSIAGNGCGAPRGRISFCRATRPGARASQIYGRALCNDVDSSRCGDVAPVGNWVVNNCARIYPDHSEAMGGAPAYGNGCLQVEVLGDF